MTLTMVEGTCKGCGQTQMVKADNNLDADIQATKKCGCEQGADIRARWKIKREVEFCCGEESRGRGFETLEQREKDAIVHIAEEVQGGLLEKVVITAGASQITLAKKGEGVNVTRKANLEIEGGDLEE